MTFPQAVNLTKMEAMQGGMCGLARRLASRFKKSADRNGDVKNPWDVDMEGACAEVALAKLFGHFWSATVNTYSDKRDVGRYEVRASGRDRSCQRVSLILRDNDFAKGRVPFFLLTGTAPNYVVEGWAIPTECRRKEWLESPCGRDPAYFVPIDALRKYWPPEPGDVLD